MYTIDYSETLVENQKKFSTDHRGLVWDEK